MLHKRTGVICQMSYTAAPLHQRLLRKPCVGVFNFVCCFPYSASSVSTIAIWRPCQRNVEMLVNLLWHDLECHACFWVESLPCTSSAMLYPLLPYILCQLKCDPAYKRTVLKPRPRPKASKPVALSHAQGPETYIMQGSYR